MLRQQPEQQRSKNRPVGSKNHYSWIMVAMNVIILQAIVFYSSPNNNNVVVQSFTISSSSSSRNGIKTNNKNSRIEQQQFSNNYNNNHYNNIRMNNNLPRKSFMKQMTFGSENEIIGTMMISNILPPTFFVSSTNIIIVASETTITTTTTESWRQYVPLVVSCFVILDILLGSPFVNTISRILFQKAAGVDDPSNMDSISNQDTATTSSTPTSFSLSSLFSGRTNEILPNEKLTVRRPERVDSKKIADAAIQKAKYTLELKDYLERNKTDQDRMNDIRRQMDQQINDIDVTLQQQQQRSSSNNQQN